MEIEQKKLDQDHQAFLSEKEAQALSEREEVQFPKPQMVPIRYRALMFMCIRKSG